MEAYVICGEKLFSCRCVLAPHNKENNIHVCDCGGSWKGRDGEPGFDILSFPELFPEFIEEEWSNVRGEN